eukprot:3164497-Pleurochrysis_carterae.AAC.1
MRLHNNGIASESRYELESESAPIAHNRLGITMLSRARSSCDTVSKISAKYADTVRPDVLMSASARETPPDPSEYASCSVCMHLAR